MYTTGVSISTDERRNGSATLLSVVGYFFPRKRSNYSFKNVVNKKYIIKSELKRKFIMMCFQGPLTNVCYALVTPE